MTGLGPRGAMPVGENLPAAAPMSAHVDDLPIVGTEIPATEFLQEHEALPILMNDGPISSNPSCAECPR